MQQQHTASAVTRGDYALKDYYRAPRKRKSLALLLFWTIRRWLIQRELKRIDKESAYWLQQEKYAAQCQRVTAVKAADGRKQLADAERAIAELNKP